MKVVKWNMQGDKYIHITKATLLFKNNGNKKIKFFFWGRNDKNNICTIKNIRFKVHFNRKGYSVKNLRVNIRLPFLYWDKDNSSWKFGLPDLYLWWHVARTY